jgi:hypothetical protein
VPDQFKHLWSLSNEETAVVWSQGLLVLDTNVLLHLYRFAEAKRDALLNVLESEVITARLWFPNQVSREFFRRRLDVISEQQASMKKAQESVQCNLKTLCDDLEKAIRKSHPLLDREAWCDRFRETHQLLERELSSKQSSYTISLTTDPFLNRVLGIMKGRLGPPYSEGERAKLEKLAEDRYAANVPPGFKDKNPGDFLIWRQILDYAAEQKRHVVFVTDDKKEDWWLKRGGQHLGALPALRKEFNGTTQREIILCSTIGFLEWANSQIGKPLSSPALSALEDDINEIYWQETPEPPYTHKSYDSPDDVSVQDMVDWFFENYKDPADGVPYDSAEGGYLYMSGGPYDAEDVLTEEFSDVDANKVEQAVEIINNHGWEWVGVYQY